MVYNLLKYNLHNGRKLFVYINGSYSTTKTIQFDVPQGSNLGPILFSNYVNDIFNIFDFTPVLYTDDTCLYVKASKEKDLESLMSREVEIANLWMKLNKLTIKGGESSSQFRWLTTVKIELEFLIFFVLILRLRLQRYSTNTKRYPPIKSFWKL